MEGLLGLGLVGLFIGCFLAATVIPFSAEILLVGALLAGCNPLTTFCVATQATSSSFTRRLTTISRCVTCQGCLTRLTKTCSLY